MYRGPDCLILDAAVPLVRLEQAIIGSYSQSGITDVRFPGIVAECLDSYVHDIMGCIAKQDQAQDNLDYYIKHCSFNCEDIAENYIVETAVCLRSLGECLLGQLERFGVYAQPNQTDSIPYYYAERTGQDALLFRHE